MPICASCRVPHEPEDCEDTQQDRHGMGRACYCQHKTHRAVVSQVRPGPECETPEVEPAAGGAA